MTNTATLLAIETATSNCSVALQFGGQVFSRDLDGNNVHSQVVLEMVEQVMAEAGAQRSQLDAVAVGQGPGSFTGLRIGVGVAQGLAYGVACPMVGITSLDALANLVAKGEQHDTILAGIDARMGEVYWCAYRRKGADLMRSSELMVSAPEDISVNTSGSTALTGNAWAVYADRLSDEIKASLHDQQPPIYPTAESVLELANIAFENGDVISPIDFAPEYVRNNVAKKSTKVVNRRI